MLYVGSTKGGSDYFKSSTLAAAVTSVTASNLPVSAHKAYVRLRYKSDDVWSFQDSVFYLVGQNNAPSFTNALNVEAIVGETYLFTPAVSEVDGESLTFTISGKPKWATFSKATGKLSGTPATTDLGTSNSVVITAQDERGATATTAATLTVVPANKPPVISGTPTNTSIRVGEVFDFTPTASDADNNTLTFAIANKPAWAAFDTATGQLSGTPTAADVGTTSDIVISVTDGKSAPVNLLPAFSISVMSNITASALTIPVATGADDVEENLSNGALDKTSTDLELVYDGKQQAVGLRFQNAKIPQGATVKNAYIQFRTDEVSSSAVSLTIKGDNADNSAVFNGAYNVSSTTARPVTTASVVWTPAAWAVVDEVSEAQRTPDLSAIVQEIVNRGGWAVNNAMSFIITGDGSSNKRIADSFEDGWAPKLVVEFEYINKAPVVNSIPTTVIPKTSPIGTQVLAVSASDPDGDSLTYSIEGSVPFAIDATGNITLNAEPQPESHTFNVKVSDGKETTTVPVTVLTLRNMAHEFGVATQNSTYGSGTTYIAQNAIDNSLDTINHTNCLADDWWQVKLPDPTLVSRIVVTGRDSNAWRLTGAEVYVSANSAANGGMNAADKVFTLAGTSTAQDILLATPKSGTYVIVKAFPKAGGVTECLHMREVEVYGQGSPTPAFSQTVYQLGLPLRTAANIPLGRVHAQDFQKDTLSYSIVENVPFSIDANGTISVTEVLNHNLAQAYTFTVRASDGTHTTAATVNVKALDGSGVNLKRWNGISGGAVADMTSNSHYQNDPPDQTETLAQLDVNSNIADGFGQTLSAILMPAQSGDYQFAIVGDDATALELSTSDSAAGAVVIARHDSWSSYQNWAAAGKSASIHLEAGNLYYIRALHKEGSGAEHVSVGWKTAKESAYSVIPAAQLFRAVLTAENVKPIFAAHQTAFLIPHTTAVGTMVAAISASDSQSDSLTYSIVGSVPFRVDGQGKIRVDDTLQGGMTYTFEVSVTDGVHSVATTVTITTTSTAAVENALQSGNSSAITATELLDASLGEIVNGKARFEVYRQQLFNLNADGSAKADSLTGISWDPTSDASLFIPTYGMNDAVLYTNAVTDPTKTVYEREIAIVGDTPARYMVMGSNPMRNHYRNNASVNDQMQQFMENSLGWLTKRNDLKTSTFNVVLAQMEQSTYAPDEVAVRAWLDAHYAGQISYNTADACDDAALAGCLTASSAPDLLIISQSMNAGTDPALIQSAVDAAMKRGIPVLYLHLDGDLTGLGGALLPLFKVRYDWDNYWKRLHVSNFNITEKPLTLPADIVAIQTMLNHFKAEDYAFDWSQCTGEDNDNCSTVPDFASQFQQGASAVRSMMQGLDSSKINIFASEDYRLQKLLALLGDKFRQDVAFPMDKYTTDDNAFLRSYFADHAVYNYRTVNPVQPDMGNFSRSNFSHITPVTKTVNMTSRQSFRAAGVYALPGQTFRVTRHDNSSTTTEVFVNTMNSGSTHEFQTLGYLRPKFLRSTAIPLKTGETIAITSPYGGPVQIKFSANDQPVQLTFQQVGEHPFWDDTADNADFTAMLAQGDYDWAEFVTPAFEIHSTLEKMRESISNTRWGGTLEGFAAATMRYVHNFPHVLAGFKGPYIDVVPEIHDFAIANSYTIENLDKVKHMNADQASCGYGCSGNPYDAYWAFDPIGHGDIHEMGHGLEKSRFRLDGWNYHSTTNPYAYYSKTQYYKTTGEDPDCQALPFKEAFTALQVSVGQADPAAYLKTYYWNAVADNWSRGASMTIQMMMTAEHQGVLQDGWHLLARLHILEREFNRAKANTTTWDAKKASLGFSSYTKAEADAITSNDWMVIAVSKASGLNYRDYFAMWGQAVSTKAAAEVAGFNYSAAPRNFFITSPSGYCKGEGFDGNNLPVNGQHVWPLAQ